MDDWLIFGLGLVAGASIIAVLLYSTDKASSSTPLTNEEVWEYTDRSGKEHVIKVHRTID